MIRIAAILSVASLAILSVPASAAGHRVYAIVAQNGSMESGTVTLTPLGDRTRVEIALTSAPDGVAQPAHIHEGPCATLNPKPKFALASVVDGVSTTVVNAPMDSLVNGGLAVNVHESVANLGHYVACGDLGGK
jgi:hypothetical protein